MSCEHLESFRAGGETLPIYKDECTQCFDSPTDEHGLDVCLTCFNGGCCEDNHHSTIHVNNTKHAIVLNLRRVRKEKEKDVSIKDGDHEEDGPAQKIQRLAIGLPGGAQLEDSEDDFDTISTVMCRVCIKELDKTSLKLSSLVDRVLLSASALKQEELKSWEPEITPCEHTLTMSQENVTILADKSLAHCNDCSITENFWLCLVCGYLGCGRKQWDGTGGNGHALAHYEATGHAIAAKTGTFEADGSADIHCYKCDDMKVDPELKAHLFALGIDISSQKKTEKSLAELELDQNRNFAFDSTMDQGKKLIPLFGAGHTGLENLGSTCYMSSVIQALFALQPFRDKYIGLALTHQPMCRSVHADCWQCQAAKIAWGLWSGRYSKSERKESDADQKAEKEKEPSQKGIPPRMFRSLVARGNDEFMSYRQQDVYEYLCHLLNFIERADRSQNETESQSLVSLFQFMATQRVQCTECKGVRYSTSDARDLPIPMAMATSTVESSSPKLVECIAEAMKPESIPGFKCAKCGHETIALKSQSFATFPNVLVLQLRRFVYEGWVPTKLDTDIAVDADGVLDLSQYVEPSDDVRASEVLLPDDSASSGPAQPQEVNDAFLNDITAMGFPEVRGRKALLATGNMSLEAAMEWIMMHMDDPDIDIDVPMKVKGKGSGGEGEVIDPGLVSVVIDMGFSKPLAELALKETGGNVERAIEWLFSHPDADPHQLQRSESESKRGRRGKSIAEAAPRYKLHAVLVHRGSGVHAGHYVAYVRDKDGWVLFNDRAVARSDEPKLGLGYLYLFSRV